MRATGWLALIKLFILLVIRDLHGSSWICDGDQLLLGCEGDNIKLSVWLTQSCIINNRWKGTVYQLSCDNKWCRSHWSNKGWFPSSVWTRCGAAAFLCIRDCPLTCGVLGRCEGCTAQDSKPSAREEGTRGTGDHRCWGDGVRTATWKVSSKLKSKESEEPNGLSA